MLCTSKELVAFLCITLVASRSKTQSEEIIDQLLPFQSKQNISSLNYFRYLLESNATIMSCQGITY